jgi:xylulokinase
MDSAPALLAIDLGTSSVKVIVTNLAGTILGAGSGDYPIDQPQPGWAEQEPERWWSQSCAATRQALATAHIAPASIAAIGLSGQMHGTVMLDEQERLIRPAVIWPDRRSAQQVTEFTDQIGAEQLLAIAGSPLATGFLAATVRWFQQKEPATWDRVRTLLLPKDWLRWRMTGAFASDPSDGAGTLLLDQRTRHWSPTLLAALELDPSLLPPLLPSTAQAGKLTAQAAAQLGLPGGIPVVTGGSDTPCGALGAGAVQPGILLLSLSTGGQLITPVTDVQTDRRGRIHTFCGVLESGAQQAGWYQMGAILAAGLALRWLRENVLRLGDGDEIYRNMSEWAAGCEPGADSFCPIWPVSARRTWIQQRGRCSLA